MIKPETTLQNQVKNINKFIQGIENLKGPIMLGGVQFFLKDLKHMANNMQLISSYVVLDIESLRRENRNLRKLLGEK